MRVGQDFVRMRLIYVRGIYDFDHWELGQYILWLARHGTTLSSYMHLSLFEKDVCTCLFSMIELTNSLPLYSAYSDRMLLLRDHLLRIFFFRICTVEAGPYIVRYLSMSFLWSLVMPRILIGLAFNFKPSWFMHDRNRIEPKIPSKIQGKLRIS